MKVALVGPQGAGKTTKAYDLAAHLKKNGKDVILLAEVARSCPFELNEGATRQTQCWVFGKQMTREQSMKGEILVSDRALLDSYIYGLRSDPELFQHADKFVAAYMDTYDYIFYCPANDEYLVDDGLRSTDKEFRDEIDSMMCAFIMLHDIPVIEWTSVGKAVDIVLGQ